MSTEALKTQIPEQTHMSAAEIAAAFQDAHRSTLALTSDPAFHEQCLSQGIDPYDDIDTQAYWEIFEDFTSRAVEDRRNSDGNSVALDAVELLAATPAYAYSGHALGGADHLYDKDRRHNKEIASYLNSLIRNFATQFPETNAATMQRSMEWMINTAIEDMPMRQEASRLTQYCIRGAQHELSFGQILGHTGRKFRPASLDEDLNGIDYIVNNDAGQPLFVDVKASLSEIESHGGQDSAYALRSHGKIIMYSLIKDSELHGKFFIADSLAAQKAPALSHLLSQAEASANIA